MKFQMHKKNNSGQLMVEVMVVAVVLTLVLTAILSGVSVAVKNSRLSKNQALATRLGQEGLEWFRARRDEQGWQPFYSLVKTDVDVNPDPLTYCLPNPLPLNNQAFDVLNVRNCDFATTTDLITLDNSTFARSLEVASFQPDEIDIVIRVQWVEGSQTFESTLEGRLNQWSVN